MCSFIEKTFLIGYGSTKNSWEEREKHQKINKVTVAYNGDAKAFDSFVESMIPDYLNSCSIAKSETPEFVGKAENNVKSA